MELDVIDFRILSILQTEGRVSNQDLADRVALSPSACLRRVRALEESTLIRGYHADLNAGLLGLGFEALVQVTLDHGSENWHDDFVKWLPITEEVVSAWVVTGNCNYILLVRTVDLQKFSDFIIEKLNRLPGVRDIHSFIVMRTLKNRAQLGLIKAKVK